VGLLRFTSAVSTHRSHTRSYDFTTYLAKGICGLHFSFSKEGGTMPLSLFLLFDLQRQKSYQRWTNYLIFSLLVHILQLMLLH